MSNNVPYNINSDMVANINKTVTDRVYIWIRNAIIIGEFKPGQKITQEDITKRLNVSRTPVRDAFQRLGAEGLIENKPFKGAFVFKMSPKEVFEIYEVRILLENYAAQKSILVATEEDIEQLKKLNKRLLMAQSNILDRMSSDRAFHKLICTISSPTYVLSLLENLWNKSDPYKSIYYSHKEDIEKTFYEHSQIIDSFRKKDGKLLEEALREHLNDVVKVAMKHPFFKEQQD